jgi:hypothetical protein
MKVPGTGYRLPARMDPLAIALVADPSRPWFA